VKRENVIIFLLFIWAVSGVSSFILFLIKEETRYLPILNDHPGIIGIASVIGNISLVIALFAQMVSLFRGATKPYWLIFLSVSALAVNLYHWHLVEIIVSR
jgi:hypothetical protein